MHIRLTDRSLSFADLLIRLSGAEALKALKVLAT
jgi:hypothetical protein